MPSGLRGRKQANNRRGREERKGREGGGGNRKEAMKEGRTDERKGRKGRRTDGRKDILTRALGPKLSIYSNPRKSCMFETWRTKHAWTRHHVFTLSHQSSRPLVGQSASARAARSSGTLFLFASSPCLL